MAEPNPTSVTNYAQPPATSNPQNSDKSAIILICLTILIYAFFFLLRCPPFPFQEDRRRPRSGNSTGEQSEKSGNDDLAYASHVNYKKGASSDETEQGGECPVCLSMYADGEELRELNVCKHTFHVFCINKWLAAHNNCPVCRAAVRVNRSGLPAEDGLQQGLPDSADSMV